jgi:hypothetical protein
VSYGIVTQREREGNGKGKGKGRENKGKNQSSLSLLLLPSSLFLSLFPTALRHTYTESEQ